MSSASAEIWKTDASAHELVTEITAERGNMTPKYRSAPHRVISAQANG